MYDNCFQVRDLQDEHGVGICGVWRAICLGRVTDYLQTIYKFLSSHSVSCSNIVRDIIGMSQKF